MYPGFDPLPYIVNGCQWHPSSPPFEVFVDLRPILALLASVHVHDKAAGHLNSIQ